MARIIQTKIQDSVEGKKQKIAFVVDEASPLRLEVFMELYTLDLDLLRKMASACLEGICFILSNT